VVGDVETEQVTRGKLLSLAGLALTVAGIAGLFYTHHLFSRMPWVLAVQAAAIVLLVWARVTFGRRSFHAAANPTAGGLVTSGPYRFIRHPIYTSACLFTLAGALASPTWIGLAWWVPIFVGSWIRLRTEETLLVGMYPDYRDYAARTRRMVPFVL
jgi:protein-S-isoprenylcysteine O-methyltransferase Ste14